MKNCHLLRRKIANFAFASLMALEASIGWATTIQGNLEVIAIPASTTAKGNLTVEGSTTLKGNTTLGNDASDTTTFQGLVEAKGDLTVDGALTIQSVDSAASRGVITNIGTTNNNNTIPTTQAVKNYADSKRDNRFSIHFEDEFTLTKTTGQGNEYKDYYRLDDISIPEPVFRNVVNGGMVMFVLRITGLVSPSNNFDSNKKIYFAVDQVCSKEPKYKFFTMTHAHKDKSGSFLGGLSYMNDFADPKLLYFCLEVPKSSGKPVLDFAQIFNHETFDRP